METDYLHTFMQVAQRGSMAEAARQLDLTPAAVAHQIRALEQTLGVQLVSRSGRTVSPTDAGHRLMQHSRLLLAEVQQLRNVVQGPLFVGKLNIGSINAVLHAEFAAIAERFSRHYPEVQMHVQAGISQQLLEKVQNGTLDLALCLAPPFEMPKSMGWIPLREEPLVVLAPTRLATADPITLLREQPFIRYDRTLGNGRQADAYLREKGIVPREHIELSSLLTIAMLVDQGQGVSLIPRIHSPLTHTLGVAHIPLPDSPVSRAFGLLWLRASARAPLIQAFQQVAREVVR